MGELIRHAMEDWRVRDQYGETVLPKNGYVN
jgi:hypothetical protein